MEEIALINPPRRRKSRKRSATARNPRRSTRRVSRRKRNPNLMLLNPGRRRRHSSLRRRNMPARRARTGIVRRRNPGIMSEFVPAASLKNIMWGGIGAASSMVASNVILPQYSKGVMGFAKDAVVILGIGWVAKQAGGKEAQTAAIVGGGSILVTKLFNTLGLGKSMGLGGLGDYADEDLGAYYGMDDMGAYYGMEDMGAYYGMEDMGQDVDEGPGMFGDDPGLFDDELDELADEFDDDEELGDDELGDEFDDDELGDDFEDDNELGDDFEDDELGDDFEDEEF